MERMASVWTIRRSTTDTKLSGLCGGVARHWGVDPVLVRVGWVVLALSGGVGLVLYLAGWLLVPADGKQASTLDDLIGPRSPRWPREAWVAVVVVACVISLAIFGSLLPVGLGPVLIIALIWYFGYYRTRAKNTPASPPPPIAPPAPPFRYPGPPTPFTEAAEAWQRRVAEAQRQAGAPSQPHPSVAPGPGPQARTSAAWPLLPEASAGSSPVQDPVEKPGPDPLQERPGPDPVRAEAQARAAYFHEPDPVGLYQPAPVATTPATPARLVPGRSRAARRLRLVGLVVLGLALTGLGIADAAGVAVPVSAYFATALLVGGLTLVAATWWGRAAGILPVSLLAALLLAGAWVQPAVGNPADWHRAPAYASVAQLPAGGDELPVGLLDVDLSQLDLAANATYRATVGKGALHVKVPADTNVVVRYAVGTGVVFAPDGEEVVSGTALDGTFSAPDTPTAGRPTLTLDLDVDHGELRVTR